MRDLLVAAIVFGTLPLVFTRPHLGIFLWSWIGYMAPHRLGWGFAFYFPFAQIIGIVTLLSIIFSREKLHFFWAPMMGWLLFFNVWMLITTIFSLQPEDSWTQLEKVIKIQLVIFLSFWIINDFKKIHTLVWVIVVSIGFYGVKGGVFTLIGGGGTHVLGPRGGFIAGNTEIGLALVMVLPLVWYLYLNTRQLWIRIGLLASMFLIPAGILGTQSRGALLAIVACVFFLWLKSSKKGLLIIAIIAAAPFLYSFMPQSWHDRMSTIQTYEEDASAQGRLQAWEFAYHLAVARPLGGGFESFHADNYERFTPGLVAAGTGKYHDVHSIYFEVLGEHGFIGLGIFLTLFFLAWRESNKIIALTKYSAENKWAHDLASMLQVSIVGYMVGGAFLGLAYFDLPYHLMVLTVVTLRIITLQSKA
ncbi:MAG: hypothetical protein RI993_268 [Pseudomonadota bacterium]